MDEERLAKALGVFSVGLGLAQVAAPGRFAEAIGAPSNKAGRRIMRGVGARELGAGAGILTRRRPTSFVWSRVGGDAIDLALLGRALASGRAQRGRLAAATVAGAGVTALDLFTAARLSRDREKPADGAKRVTHATTVNREPAQVYAFWRDLRNLPRFMAHLESVETRDSQRSHWKAKGPAGKSVEWDAEVTLDRPGEAISWRSLPGADVENEGTVRFRPAPGGRGTEIVLEMRYRPPAGGLGVAVATLFGQEPGQQTRDDLRRFKQVIETGEIVRSEGSPGGMDTGKLMKQRPAQPLKDGEAQSPGQRPVAMAASSAR